MKVFNLCDILKYSSNWLILCRVDFLTKQNIYNRDAVLLGILLYLD